MKKLPIYTNSLNGYLCNSFPLAIAMQSDKTKGWFYSNFIQLVLAGNFPDGKFFTFYNSHFNWNELFLSCPFIKYQKIDNDFMENYTGGIISFIRDSINKNGYVILYIDEFYISQSSNYKYMNLPHEMFIYGFSENDFFVLGYDNQGRFGELIIDINEFKMAYTMCERKDDFRKYIYILKYNEYYEYNFDNKLVLQWLIEYRYSLNSSIHYRSIEPPNEWWYYGISSYKHINSYMNNILLSAGGYIDTRLFHTIWEHKVVMLERVKYMRDYLFMEDCAELLEECKKLCTLSLSLRNLTLKYNLTQNHVDLNAIIEYFNKLEDLEILMLDHFIKLLKDYAAPQR